MSRKIDYICNNCGHIEIKKKSWKKRMIGVGKVSYKVVIILFALIGVLSVYNFSIDQGYTPELKVFSMGGLNSFFLNNFGESSINESDAFQLKQIAINLTEGCDTNLCKTEKVYDYLKIYDPYYNPTGTFKYQIGTDLEPMNIWNEKEGDCDELAFLFVSLMTQLNINSKMQCSNNHCWALTFTDGKRVISDLTKFNYQIEA